MYGNLIKTHHIDIYSRCPKRSFYSWNSALVEDPNVRVIGNVIKTAYAYYARKNVLASWKSIIGWTEKFIAEEQNTKDCLLKLSTWYGDYYLDKHLGPGLINLPIKIPLDQHTSFQDQVDLIIFGKQLTLADFSGASPRKTRLYNDIRMHTHIWSVMQVQGKPEKYIRFHVRPKSILPIEITLSPQLISKSAQVVSQICDNIRKGIFYPSVSEQCQHCPFEIKCSF